MVKNVTAAGGLQRNGPFLCLRWWNAVEIPHWNFRVSMEWEADTWQDVEGEMLHGANREALYIV
jgi:hypothetical protein